MHSMTDTKIYVDIEIFADDALSNWLILLLTDWDLHLELGAAL